MLQPEPLKDIIVKALEDIQAQDIRVFEVSDISDITDYMIVVSGRSDRHIKAIYNAVMDELLKHKIKPIGKEGVENPQWVLLDYDDVVLHVLSKEAREFYDLESLWNEQARQLIKTRRQTV